ncbi:MAG: pseudouridine synthase [Lachnospiraceae bacterium]|nr:pseudouridine synthase [Lachnospiraceae bacterium]
MARKYRTNKQNETGDGTVRLNKYLSDAGICSRRQADAYIDEGKVTVDGTIAKAGTKIHPTNVVCFMGKPIKPVKECILLLVNKPRGIVCTTKGQKNNIVDFLNYKERIYPVGRLDVASEGLLLMTNDGDLMNEILRARNFHEKEYIVTVNKKIEDSFIKSMRQGIFLPELNVTTRPCKVKKIEADTFSIILTQGLNRQIRRMCEALDYKVVRLKRIRIMNLKLGNLKRGQSRKATEGEMEKLYSLIEQSKGEAEHGTKTENEGIN